MLNGRQRKGQIKMNELTFNYRDEAFTDSIILAKGAGIEHRAVNTAYYNLP